MRNQVQKIAIAFLVPFLALPLAAPTASATPIIPIVDVDDVERQVEGLQRQAASAAEDWNESRLELSKVQRKIDSLRDVTVQQKASRNEMLDDLAVLIRAMYVQGGMDLDFQALMADNPSQFLQQLDALSIVGKRQQIASRRLQAANISIATTKSNLLVERKKSQKLVLKAKEQLVKIQAKLDEAERLLNTLEAADRRAREARLAAARKKQLKEAKKNNSSIIKNVSNAKLKKVMNYALSQIGDDYRLGGSGPSSYDCSGLTMMAYRQAGISLSHFSGSQWSQTRRVSRSQLRPGDLVFFFKGIRHVGMYIGNNKMVHAANYGTGVIISSLSESYYVSRLSGYGRVIG
jgi:peptidoglycan DL-endopeptidase CwlO